MSIFARSPYIVEISETGQDGSKVELFIWNGTGAAPTSPTYTLTKLIPASNNVKTYYNISPYIREYLIIGQNLLGFDAYIHNTYRRLMGKKSNFSYVKRIIDTNCIAKAIKKNLKPQRDSDFTFWQYRLNDFREKGLKTSIKTQLKEYKIDFDENMLHNSMYDVQMNFKIFTKQLWQVEI